MSKNTYPEETRSKHPNAKIMGRSTKRLVVDPVIGDTVSEKMLASRKKNKPER